EKFALTPRAPSRRPLAPEGPRMSPRAKRLAATLAGMLAATVAAVMTATPASGAAVPETRRAPTPDWVMTVPLAQREADVQRVMDYWTPDRLKAASSYATPARRAPQTSPAPTGTTTSTATATERPTTVQPTRGRAKVKNGLPTTVGKVFFRIGDRHYFCSATAVHSPNRNLVATAAHCAYDVQQMKPVEDWIFVPGYTADSRAEWGIYVGHTLNLHDNFAGLVDWDYDYAFVTVH